MSRSASIPSGRTPADPRPAGTLEFAVTGELLAADDVAMRMFGLQDGDLAGMPVDRLLRHPAALDQLAAAGPAEPDRIALEGRRSSGVPFPLRGTVRVVEDRAERRVQFRLSELGRDELIAVAGRFFEVGFDEAPIGMALFNCDGEYVRVNAALCRMLGRPESDLIGRRDQELTHPEDRESDLDVAREILEGRRDTHQTEKRFVRPDGSVVWTIANLTFLRDEAGGALLWVGQFQDVTARRAAEEAHRRERDLSQAIIDSMHDGFVLTSERKIVAVNDAICRLTGFSRDELIGQTPPYGFWPPERRTETLAMYERTAALGGEVDVTLMRRDGTRFHASIATSLARTSGDAPDALVGIIRDISERKRHERELERQATRDGLTGLLNRTAFLDRLHDAIARARATRTPLALALLDLDHFKAINDRHGHPVGDRVLVEAAERLREVSRAGDHLARVGGEEFAWVLPGIDAHGAMMATERARLLVERSVLAGLDDVTISIGVCDIEHAADVDELYRLADVALYRAKALGRNRCVRHRALGDDGV